MTESFLNDLSGPVPKVRRVDNAGCSRIAQAVSVRHSTLLLTALAALACSLTGCSSPSATPAAAAASATSAPATSAALSPTAKAVDFAKLAKADIDANICITKPLGCANIKSFEIVGTSLAARTNLYPDSDATAPASSICSYLLSYVNDSKTSSDDLSSTVYVYGSTGSRIKSCTTPLSR